MLRILGGTYQPMHWVIGRQMLVTDVDPAMTHELIPDPLSPCPEALGQYYLRQSSSTK